MALIVGDFMVADDGVDRTFGNTDRAIYALIGMNDQKIGAFHKAIHRTNADAIRVLALNAGLGNYKCHGFPKPLFPSLAAIPIRSEEHTSELQSLMRISYAVFCLKKKNII